MSSDHTDSDASWRMGCFLNDLTTSLGRHAVISEEAQVATALWGAHTHVYERFRHTPRLDIHAPTWGCGKTVVLDFLNLIVRSPDQVDNTSAAAIFRTIDASKGDVTLLLDEVHTYLTKSDELINIAKSGFQRGKKFKRCGKEKKSEAWTPENYDVFCPMALAGIGTLPAEIRSRSIPIKLKRRLKTESIEELEGEHLKKLETIKRGIALWFQYYADGLNLTPPMPKEMGDREADISRPLLSIADAAGPEWGDRARDALVALFKRHRTDTPNMGLSMLADIRRVFGAAGVDRIWSKALVDALVKMEERPWAAYREGLPITTVQIRGLIRDFDIRSTTTIRIGGETDKGYYREWFQDAWARYLPDTGPSLEAMMGGSGGDTGETSDSTPDC